MTQATPMMPSRRSGQGLFAGFAIGSLGGMIGLGGAEFRLPLLVGLFRLGTLEAVILNKAVSLIVVSVALLSRSASIPWLALAVHADIVVNLLLGTLAGAWWAAGHAMAMPRQQLDRIILAMLLTLALLILGEALFGLEFATRSTLDAGPLRFILGLLAGFGIGCVAALLGVAGGELLIPTLVLLYGLDIKLAGSLSLLISLPTMLVGFLRYRSAEAFAILTQERALFRSLSVGSLLGAIAGGLLLGWIPTRWLLLALGLILLWSAIKTFQHTKPLRSESCS